jgi:3-oxoacyl-[acyl-carrier protein] reductase
MIDLSGQCAIVTGGSRGIGAATSLMLAKAGANVGFTFSNNRTEASKIRKMIIGLGRQCLAMKVHVEKSTDCQKFIRVVQKKFGRVDILVNNAGIWEYGKVSEMTDSTWQKTIDINLNSTFNMCHFVIPVMKRQKYGRIINISSTAGQRGECYHSHYAASKGAIISFTKSIAVEVIKDGIWVNCVAPGWVRTDMTSNVWKNSRLAKKVYASIPLGRFAEPEEIAGPILFLTSHLANNIIGEILNVNGGSVLCG